MKKYRIKTSNDNPRLAIHHDDIIELEELPEKETLEEKFIIHYRKNGYCAGDFANIARTHFMENPEELGLIGKVENMVSKEKVLREFDKAVNIEFNDIGSLTNGDSVAISRIREALEAL